MKKFIYTLFIVLLGINNLSAQQTEKREKLKAYKATYITQELDLTTDEAEKFWPVYNTYQKKLHQLKVIKSKEVRNKIKEKGGVEALTNKEAEEILRKLEENDQAILKEKHELFESLKNIISSKKILKLHYAEGEFNRKLLREYRQKKHMGAKN
ncbi:MAG: sensor of ECF-type sigma factor [Flavobacteriaceae bacterium]|nr:sensor of ECF-type sigma factor [Flavobacteriaceae bacterium]